MSTKFGLLIVIYFIISINLIKVKSSEINCEEQLASYRKFILSAILNFEDVCDVYETDAGGDFLLAKADTQRYRPEIWAFFKLLMAQFKDIEFVDIIKEAVELKCKEKSLRNEKRDGVVIGKKQRFHSWGGKRSSLLPKGYNNFEHYLVN